MGKGGAARDRGAWGNCTDRSGFWGKGRLEACTTKYCLGWRYGNRRYLAQKAQRRAETRRFGVALWRDIARGTGEQESAEMQREERRGHAHGSAGLLGLMGSASGRRVAEELDRGGRRQ